MMCLSAECHRPDDELFWLSLPISCASWNSGTLLATARYAADTS